MPEAQVKVKDLVKYFPVRGSFFSKSKRFVHAVDKISFKIYKRKTLGLVGESGCGKTTTARCILHLIKPTSGEIYFKGRNLGELKGAELRNLRRDMSMVFQDPFSSLNPRMLIKDIVGEPALVNKIAKGEKLERLVSEQLTNVGLEPEYIHRFPYQFSGGQRQRISIARALILRPSFVVLDEPTSALDVSVQANILNLLLDLQKQFGLAYLFISHDLNVVRYMSDYVTVLYLGEIVEMGDVRQVYESPLHPYTKGLLKAVPVPDFKVKNEKVVLTGDVPSSINPPSGCRFHPRCPYAKKVCSEKKPEFVNLGGTHKVACHLLSGA